MSSTYVYDLEELTKTIVGRRSSLLRDELQKKAREVFKRVTGISEEESLVLYGEQADPPIVKNVGKTILAEVVVQKLRRRNIPAQAVHLVLYDDVFGSNREVFQQFISKNLAEKLSSQTYAFAPTPEQYVRAYYEASVREGGEDALESTLEALLQDAKGKSIGLWNIAVREVIEKKILPCSVKRISFTDLERAVLKNKELREALLGFSSLTGSQGEGVYVTFRSEEGQKDQLDTGHRRYFVKRGVDRSYLINPRSGKVMKEGTFEELITNPQCVAVSLNAASRVVLAYLLTAGGAHVTGGGSVYNDPVAQEYVRKGYAQPLLTHSTHAALQEYGHVPAAMLVKKKTVIKNIIHDAQDILRADDERFGGLAKQ